ncbi:hypothetical protein [Streptomyces sp. L2]|uniref:hypothetical protein n=1 Tax=Streptomyces sp. L2 TaxID=2162665 RepID=UPI001F5143CB|nr:hypothetical protein [Streptomyces sp. L2]
MKSKSTVSAMLATLAVTGGLQLANATISSADVNHSALNGYLHIPLTVRRAGASTITWGVSPEVPASIRNDIRKALSSWSVAMNNPQLFREAKPGEQVGFQFSMANLGHNGPAKILGSSPYVGCSGAALRGCLTAKLDNVLTGMTEDQAVSVIAHEFGHALNLNHSVNGRTEEIMLSGVGDKPSVRPTSDEAIMANHFNNGLLGNPRPNDPNWPRPEFGNQRGWDPKTQSWLPYAEWYATYASTPHLTSDGWYGYDPSTHSYVPRTDWNRKYRSPQDGPGTKGTGQEPKAPTEPAPGDEGKNGYQDTRFYAQTADGAWHPFTPGAPTKDYVGFTGYGMKSGVWQEIKDPGGYVRRAEQPSKAGENEYDKTQFYGQTADGAWHSLTAGASTTGYSDVKGYGMANGDWQEIKDPRNYIADHKPATEEQKAADETRAQAQVEADAKAKEEADRKAQEEADRKAKEEADRKAKEEADRKAKEEADRKAKEEADRKAKEEADRKAKEEADRKAKEEADRKAKEEADRKAKEEADRKAKEEADRKAKEEADRKAKEEADRKAKEEADRKAKEEADRKAKEEADRKAKEEADRKAKEEADRKAKEEADRQAREEADRQAREEADRQAREEADRQAREEADRRAREEADRRAEEHRREERR